MKEKMRKTNLAISLLVQKLYGNKGYREIKNYQDIGLTKKYYLKILKSFFHSINQTIEISDKGQINELNNIIKHGEGQIKLCNKFDDIDQIFIAIQSELIFQLIGHCPERYTKENVINRKENWKLNGIRQIMYVQNKEQKELAIFHIIQNKFIAKFGNWGNFVSVYYKECNNDIDCLIDYLQSNHPEIYREIQ